MIVIIHICLIILGLFFQKLYRWVFTLGQFQSRLSLPTKVLYLTRITLISCGVVLLVCDGLQYKGILTSSTYFLIDGILLGISALIIIVSWFFFSKGYRYKLILIFAGLAMIYGLINIFISHSNISRNTQTITEISGDYLIIDSKGSIEKQVVPLTAINSVNMSEEQPVFKYRKKGISIDDFRCGYFVLESEEVVYVNILNYNNPPFLTIVTDEGVNYIINSSTKDETLKLYSSLQNILE